MAKKRISELLQEEAQKFTPDAGDSAIEVTATVVTSETEKQQKQNEQKATPSEDPKLVELSAKIKDLQDSLDASQKNEESLRQEIAMLRSQLADKDASVEKLKKDRELKSQQQEELLQTQIDRLQSQITEKDGLVEKCKNEVYEAKKAALQLAELNTKLTEEINSLKSASHKPVPQRPLPQRPVTPAAPPKAPIVPAKAIVNPTKYRKSYRPVDPLPSKPSNSDDNSSQMWLLD